MKNFQTEHIFHCESKTVEAATIANFARMKEDKMQNNLSIFPLFRAGFEAGINPHTRLLFTRLNIGISIYL